MNEVVESDYIIVDLEATCWEGGNDHNRQETIEIGAVRFSPKDGLVLGLFSTLIRPVLEPKLTDYCTGLTGIRQNEVDHADPFPEVFPRFIEWCGPGPHRLASWGSYDLRQLTLECQRHSLSVPAWFSDHLNIKYAFAQRKKVRPCGMAHALKLSGLPPEGRHHRGLDDALNIAKLAALALF
jgi:inhibitor of KinA sporulation pathway (predicted exonuclease)